MGEATILRIEVSGDVISKAGKLLVALRSGGVTPIPDLSEVRPGQGGYSFVRFDAKLLPAVYGEHRRISILAGSGGTIEMQLPRVCQIEASPSTPLRPNIGCMIVEGRVRPATTGEAMDDVRHAWEDLRGIMRGVLLRFMRRLLVKKEPGA